MEMRTKELKAKVKAIITMQLQSQFIIAMNFVHLRTSLKAVLRSNKLGYWRKEVSKWPGIQAAVHMLLPA
jgi:hypothetical protein